MTKQSEVLDNPNYRAVLDHGFVGIVETMGSDAAIVSAARVSYGDGTKSVREDRGLIRYLVRHRHTSPLEMCQIKLHVRCPILVMRQWVRHRTASLNEYSGRYSVMSDEFYVPALDQIKAQSSDNKQGRSVGVGEQNAEGVQWLMNAAYETNYAIYKTLLGERADEEPYDPYDPSDPLLDGTFPGVAREIARAVLPVANYTEFYWSQNLHNMLHLLKLRMDPHAQYEIRVFADAIYELIQPLFPAACEAFEDYIRGGVNLSRMDVDLLQTLLHSPWGAKECFIRSCGENTEKDFAEAYGMSARELKEFCQQWGLPTYQEACILNGERKAEELRKADNDITLADLKAAKVAKMEDEALGVEAEIAKLNEKLTSIRKVIPNRKA